jgi:predicted Zn-dependent protease
MIATAIGLAGILIWAAVFYFGRRFLDRQLEVTRTEQIRFELEAAPWSEKHVETMLARNPRSEMLLTRHVWIAVELGDLPEALRRADLLLKRAPRSAEARLVVIDMLRRAGQEEQAARALREAAHRFPNEFGILLAEAREAIRRKDPAEALRYFERLRHGHRQSPEGYTEAADVLLGMGRRQEAESVLAEGLRHLPDHPNIWRSMAYVAERAGDLDEALRRWQETRERFPDDAESFRLSAEMLARAGRRDEAAALIRQARDFFPGDKAIKETAARLAQDAEKPAIAK